MPSKTSEYFPRPSAQDQLQFLHRSVYLRSIFCGLVCCSVNSFGSIRTYLTHHLVVLQHSPGDVYAVIVPICSWHLLVDVGVDSRHGVTLKSFTLLLSRLRLVDQSRRECGSKLMAQNIAAHCIPKCEKRLKLGAELAELCSTLTQVDYIVNRALDSGVEGVTHT